MRREIREGATRGWKGRGERWGEKRMWDLGQSTTDIHFQTDSKEEVASC